MKGLEFITQTHIILLVSPPVLSRNIIVVDLKLSPSYLNYIIFAGQVANFEQESIDDVTSLAKGLIPTRHRPVRAISNDAFINRITRELLQEADPCDDSILRFLCGASSCIRGIVNDCLW